MKKLLLVAMVLSSVSAFAQESDLTIPGEKWIAKFNKYVCAAFEDGVPATTTHSDLNIQFSQITTDYTLDNGLIKATFTQDGVTCRYSAIMFADNAASTIKLIESKAFAPEGGSDCNLGREVIDSQLIMNDYLYYGHPHNLAIMVPDSRASEVCGEAATHIGINFVVSGRINRN